MNKDTPSTSKVKFNNQQDTSEVDETDIKLIKLLKMDDTPEPPEFIRENVLNAYRKEFRYRILWTKFKDRLIELVSFNPYAFMARQVSLLIASMVILIGVGTFLYYQYQASKNTNQNNLISNQQKIKETPIVMPIAKTSISPTDAQKNGNSSNKIDKNTNFDNKLASEKPLSRDNSKEQLKPGKNKKNITNTTTGAIGNEQIALNVGKDETTKDVFRGNRVKNISLAKIERFYVDSFGEEMVDKDLREAFIESLKNNTLHILEPNETVVNNEYGLLRKKGFFIQIVNPNNDLVLWEKSIENTEGSSKQIADETISQLVMDIGKIK